MRTFGHEFQWILHRVVAIVCYDDDGEDSFQPYPKVEGAPDDTELVSEMPGTHNNSGSVNGNWKYGDEEIGQCQVEDVEIPGNSDLRFTDECQHDDEVAEQRHQIQYEDGHYTCCRTQFREEEFDHNHRIFWNLEFRGHAESALIRRFAGVRHGLHSVVIYRGIISTRFKRPFQNSMNKRIVFPKTLFVYDSTRCSS